MFVKRFDQEDICKHLYSPMISCLKLHKKVELSSFFIKSANILTAFELLISYIL